MPNLIASMLSIVRGSRVAVDTHRATPLGLVLARVARSFGATTTTTTTITIYAISITITIIIYTTTTTITIYPISTTITITTCIITITINTICTIFSGFILLVSGPEKMDPGQIQILLRYFIVQRYFDENLFHLCEFQFDLFDIL